MMGINGVKLAILCALADAGGSLTTPEILAALQGTASEMTVGRHLHDLEEMGYVHGEKPPNKLPPLPVRWTLDEEAFHRDLDQVKVATTRRSRRL